MSRSSLTARAREVLPQASGGSGRLEGEELAEARWRQYEADPRFFSEVVIAKDGGFSEADRLFSTVRYLYATLALVSIGLNIHTLSVRNLDLLLTRWKNNTWFQSSGLSALRSLLPKNKAGVEFDPIALVAVFEILLLVLAVLRLLHYAFAALCPCISEEKRWRATANLFWAGLCRMPSLSGMQMLYYVTPAVLVADLSAAISKRRHWSDVALFAATRVAAAIVGTFSFLLKLHLNAQLVKTNSSSVVSTIVFVNQLLGIVQVQLFAKKRILSFIFAGEDGLLSKEEALAMEIWHAMLTQKFWQVYSFPRFVAVMLTFSDYDFQMLALNSAGGAPGEATSAGGAAGEDTTESNDLSAAAA